MVIRTNESSTRTPATIRRLTAVELREDDPTGLERGAGDPRTAIRALRFLCCTRAPSVRKSSGDRELRPVVVAPLLCLAAVDRLELLEAAARADRDARERALGEMDRHLRLVAEALVEAVQERAAAGEHDPAVHDVRRELRRRLVERRLDRLDDLADGAVERPADLLAAEHDRLRQPGEHVAATHLRLHLV